MVLQSLANILRFGENKKLKILTSQVEAVNELESKFQNMSDADLKQEMDSFRQRVKDGEELDSILPEVFALVRETAKRTVNMRHFDVQIMGGIVLFEGKISEMKTGEGKTLVATLPVVLNSLSGQPCHIVTVNDYLAKRDSEWMTPIYEFLGVTVGLIQNQMDDLDRIQAYQCDVVYGTNSEFGFDYLRDNMKNDIDEKVQRGHHFAIVDEVDSILIDEARTPLIISGAPVSASADYSRVNMIVKGMDKKVLAHEPISQEDKDAEAALEKDNDFVAFEKERRVKETARGQEKLAKSLGYSMDEFFGGEYEKTNKLSNEEQFKILKLRHIFQQSMIANSLYINDKDYVVKEGEVLIVDEFTGRLMEGRRYSEGLHQAIEAKEGVRIQEESQTLATVTLQNYFRMYEKLAGMTGTASTEADEFLEIYKLDTVSIPTNRPMVRNDKSDVIYKNEDAKFKALLDEIEECHKRGQPILVGTVSIEKNELLGKYLKRRSIKHELLNAKNHEREAEIIAQAGRKGAVTVATNMAGRGVDIILGGTPPDKKEAEEVKALGGLHVLGTERHESRRIDNQLRGRSGRQGDPGSSQFFLSCKDDLMRLFAGDRIIKIMETFNLPEDQPIENSIISKSIENAQKQVESLNFAARKQILEYDDVKNKQREVIYGERDKLMSGEDLHEMAKEFLNETIDAAAARFANENTHPEEWSIDGLLHYLGDIFPLTLPEDFDLEKTNYYELLDVLQEEGQKALEEKRQESGEYDNEHIRFSFLEVINEHWKNHLTELDYFEEGIHLRAFGQRDPLVEFKSEAYDMFQNLIYRIKEDGLRFYFKTRIVKEPSSMLNDAAYSAPSENSIASVGGGQTEQTSTSYKAKSRVGRNDPCPCGSGKKYKRCCGA